MDLRLQKNKEDRNHREYDIKMQKQCVISFEGRNHLHWWGKCGQDKRISGNEF